MTKFQPVITREHLGGPQRVYRFENGYGASVIQNMYSRGTEMAVIKWDGNDYDLVYDTPLTNDVINWMDESEVEEALERISSLTEDGREPSQATA